MHDVRRRDASGGGGGVKQGFKRGAGAVLQHPYSRCWHSCQWRRDGCCLKSREHTLANLAASPAIETEVMSSRAYAGHAHLQQTSPQAHAGHAHRNRWRHQRWHCTGTFACGAKTLTRAFSRAKYDGVQLMPIKRTAEGDRICGKQCAPVIPAVRALVSSAQATLPSPHPVTDAGEDTPKPKMVPLLPKRKRTQSEKQNSEMMLSIRSKIDLV